MNEHLASALNELLAAGPLTPTQLQQLLADGGASIHYEAIVGALRKLSAAGRAQRLASGAWAQLADPATAVVVTLDPPASPAQESNVSKVECSKCGEERAPSEMIQRNGKPSRLCRSCFSAAHQNRGAKAAPAKVTKAAHRPAPARAAARAQPVAKRSAPASGSCRVQARVAVEITDADGQQHAFVLTAEQARELAEALA